MHAHARAVHEVLALAGEGWAALLQVARSLLLDIVEDEEWANASPGA